MSTALALHRGAQFSHLPGTYAHLPENQAIRGLENGSSTEPHEWFGLGATITIASSFVDAFVPLSSGLGATNLGVVATSGSGLDQITCFGQ